ncbi:uncharacterized protein LOC132892291 [Neoarius graeffei]|uniref:uncharacterized protein LOC132892291 n=1 Tax=Neoarius graeffei TaxID=443677 RepID=UPI00298C02C0|nr:uncharacterized protein LOC132892291 [Neoarius graeffei]
MGISGRPVTETFSVNLPCESEGGIVTSHSFLISHTCPVNLLARDLMCKLGVNLMSTPDGLTIEVSEMCGVQYGFGSPLYVYVWRLCSDQLTQTPKHLVQLARLNTSSVDTDYMKEEDLHCTAHVHQGQDVEFEKTWFADPHTCERLTLKTTYWSKHYCAVQVHFTRCPNSCINANRSVLKHVMHGLRTEDSEVDCCQHDFFDIIDSIPHVSLAKPRAAHWRDVGKWVKKCAANDNEWSRTEDPSVLFCQRLGVYKQSQAVCVHVKRSVILATDDQGPGDPSRSGLFVSVSTGITPAEVHPKLAGVPNSVWAKGKHDVGLIKNAEPVVITPKSDFRPRQTQYPLKPEAIAVKKARKSSQPDEWRFVQDLQAVNAAVVPRAPDVPNPYTILGQVPADSKWFSVVDLANAFFSIPIHKDSQYWFAFMYDGRPYTFTRLCQGYCESPTIYNQCLRDSLASLTLSPRSALLQYVDDLMICAPTKAQCEDDTITLLRHLAKEGHKASLTKLQFAKQKVHFLGHDITGEGKTLSADRVSAIQKIPKPITVKQVLSFLGMCSYCRAFIPNYSILESPVRELVHGSSLTASSPVVWTPEAEEAFLALKGALQTTPTLGLPDPNKPFVQTVDEKKGFMTSVLLQKHGDRLRPVAYFSSRLDPVAAGLPVCLRAVAAAEKAVTASRNIVGYSNLTLLVPHAVSLLLLEKKTSHLSAQRWLKYNTVILDMPNITVKRCTVLNPASLLPTEDDGEPHDCVALTNDFCSPRADLKSDPLENPDMILYVDGSASRDPETGKNKVGFAIVSDHEVLKASRLPSNLSAQAAELCALIEACKLAAGQSVNIFTDSRYAFGVVHDFGTIWKHRNFLTSTGSPIAHHKLVSELLDAVLLPRAIAVCKCAAHTNNTDLVSQGNARADAAAKCAASASSSPSNLAFPQVSIPCLQLADLQSTATQDERRVWKQAGCILANSVWVCPSGRPCLPKYMFPFYAKLAHGLTHVSKGGMVAEVTKRWFTKGFSNYAAKFCKQCLICAQHNAGQGIRLTQAAHPIPDKPFDHLQMDFIELTPSEGKRYCLVIVDMFSKWVEVFPTAKQDSEAVVKALLRDVIPRWGIPSKISSDNGTPFVNAALKKIGAFLGIDLKQHCAYHPASAGAVERENGSLKNKLSKACAETGLGWTKVLPVALTQMRMQTRPKHGLSPFEILFGRVPNTGIGLAQGTLPDTTLCDDAMLNYCATLSSALKSIHKQVKEALPKPAEGPLHDLQPGDWIVVKDFRRTKWNKPRWNGPFQVLLTTPTAVKVTGRVTWIHASHCRRVPEPAKQEGKEGLSDPDAD